MKLELIMPISAGLREDIAVYGGFIGQQYILLLKPVMSLIILSNSLELMPHTGRLAMPFASSTPTRIYPPPILSKSLAKAQMV